MSNNIQEKSSLNILIVDDEQAILNIFSAGLKYRGHNCFVASNGKDGLSIVQREKIHFSLLDIRLPDVNGIDLCSSIKRISPGTINVLVTGYLGIKSTLEGMKNCSYDYLVKPFCIEQVLAIIDKAKRDMKFVGENRGIVEMDRNLKKENEQLKQFIHEMSPEDIQQRNQPMNKYKTLKSGQEKAVKSYSKHKDFSGLMHGKN